MRSQLDDIQQLLAEQGWRVDAKELAPRDWWLDETWTLVSTWTPVGELAYLSVLVDPQAPPDRARGEHVWAISLTRHKPLTMAQARPEVPLHPHWQSTYRSKFIETLRALRTMS